MEEEKKTFQDWIHAHRKKLIIAGVSLTAIIALVISIKKRDTLEETWSHLRKLATTVPAAELPVETIPIVEVSLAEDSVVNPTILGNKIPHDVSAHLRNLPYGQKASAGKIEAAAEHGFHLHQGQTWVKAYRTGDLAA